MGASLGGLNAIGSVLRGLPPTFRTPILIVQHRWADSDSRLSSIFNETTPLEVVEPDDKDRIEEGKIYLCPADYHLLVDGQSIALSVDEPVSYSRPSIDVLFESAADSDFDPVVGVLLTASSDDGAAGIAAIARAGGITIVQKPEEAESPVAIRAALKLCSVSHVSSIQDIPKTLGNIFA